MNEITKSETEAIARAEDVNKKDVMPDTKPSAEESTALAKSTPREFKRDYRGRFSGERTKKRAEKLQREMLKMISSKRPGSKTSLIVDAARTQLEYVAENASEKGLSGASSVIEKVFKVATQGVLNQDEPNSGITVLRIPHPVLMHPEIVDERDDPWRHRPTHPSWVKPEPEPANVTSVSISTNPKPAEDKQ